MSDTSGGTGDEAGKETGRETGKEAGRQREPVGSVGEEAAKLLGALQEWARDQGQDYAGTASGAADAFGRVVHDVNEHVATGSADCRYCPVCQVIHVVRQTSPEVRQNLALAASSLMNAAAGMLATQTQQPARGGVEKIDLDDDAPGEDRS